MKSRLLKVVLALSLSLALCGCATVQKNAKVLPPPPASFVPLEAGA